MTAAASIGASEAAFATALAGQRVVVPRGGAWGARAAELLHARGAEPVILPLIETVPSTDPDALAAAVGRLEAGAYDWVVVTSATAVTALVEADASGLHLPAGTRVAAVGEPTAAALAAAGLPVHFVPHDDFSARALVDEWPDRTPGRRVLAPLSAIAAPTLVDGLRAHGLEVDVVEAYSTVTATPDADELAAIVSGGIHAVLVTSGSVARAVAELLPEASSATIACLGPRTAVESREAGLRVDVVAPRQTVEALIEALATNAAATPAAVPTATEASAPVVTRRRARIRTANPFSGATAMPFPTHRPRRLRSSPAMRRLVAETRLHPAQLILPMFIREGLTEPAAIGSMPGVMQHSLDSFRAALHDAAEAGIGGVMLFGVPEHKDAVGSGATDEFGILNVATRLAAAEVGDALVVQTDLCLDEFTDHGHCGVLDHTGRVDNDATLDRYREMALAQASAGSALLGLSGMMDGQVAAVRDALDGEGFTDTAVLGYAAKYASAFYGPFREAVASSLQGDRRTYQQDPANRREGLREAQLDLDEGADIIMVKPAMGFLDVLADVAAQSPVPVWAYQVSGEYAMIEAAAANGWIDRDAAILESLISIRRAGADAVLTYWAVEAARAVR